jgi:LPXTG-site transpeptidase (sortase) family protein
MRKIGLVGFLILVGLILMSSTTRFLAGQAADPVVQLDLDLPTPASTPADSAPTATPSEILQTSEPGAELAFPLQVSTEILPVIPTQAAPASQQGSDGEPDFSPTIFGEIDQLVIPKIKLDTPIVFAPFEDFTWDVSTIGQKIAWLGGREDQKQNNLILAGHVTLRDGSNGPFRYLFAMQPGDAIQVYTRERVYTFTVRETVLVYPDKYNVTNDSPRPQVTLITCETWDKETLTYLRRRVVFADLENIQIRQADTSSVLPEPDDQQ